MLKYCTMTDYVRKLDTGTTSPETPAFLCEQLKISNNCPVGSEETMVRIGATATSPEVLGCGGCVTEMREDLEQSAATDELTGLKRRQAFLDSSVEAVKQDPLSHQSRRSRTFIPDKFAVLFVDIDDFGPVNKTFGTREGDKMLGIFADGLKLRSYDIVSNEEVGRWGGDEFAITLPWTDLAGALEVADRLRKQFMTTAILPDGTPLTASLGVALGRVHQAISEQDIRQAIERADQAMLRAKYSKNSVGWFDDEHFTPVVKY